MLLFGGNGWTAQPNSQNKNNFVYHIFVRPWADTPTDSNEIGDLKGIREKLHYFNDGHPETDDDLEVGILWLMPVFPSPSYHGYDVTDFRAVNPDYSTLQDLKDLAAAAHQRGVRIIPNIPFNHTSKLRTVAHVLQLTRAKTQPLHHSSASRILRAVVELHERRSINPSQVLPRMEHSQSKWRIEQ